MTDETIQETKEITVEWTREQLESMIATWQSQINELNGYISEKQLLLDQLLGQNE